jgi:pimeloyl-ACP methyl ester carboxylesterase
MSARSLQVHAPDRRRLDVAVAGPDGGRPLILHTGTPAAGIPFDAWVRHGAERGFRHICHSRPGYAASERQPGRTVRDCAVDVAAIADQLGFDRFFTAGISGGGPHALACAALLGDRVIAAGGEQLRELLTRYQAAFMTAEAPDLEGLLGDLLCEPDRLALRANMPTSWWPVIGSRS